MSLEAALAENTLALNAVAILLKESNDGRALAVETITGGKVGRPAGSKNKDKPAETPAVAAKVEPPKAPAIPSVDDVRAAAVSFTSVPDEKLKAERKDFLRAVVEQIGCKVVEVAEEDRAKVIGWFEAKARGEAVVFDEGQDEPAADEPDEDDIG